MLGFVFEREGRKKRLREDASEWEHSHPLLSELAGP